MAGGVGAGDVDCRGAINLCTPLFILVGWFHWWRTSEHGEGRVFENVLKRLALISYLLEGRSKYMSLHRNYGDSALIYSVTQHVSLCEMITSDNCQLCVSYGCHSGPTWSELALWATGTRKW